LNIQVFAFDLFLNLDGGHILIFILFQSYLQNDQICVGLRVLGVDVDVVYLTVTVEIEVVDLCLRIVELLLKLFEILRFAEQLRHNIEVKPLSDFGGRGNNGDLLRPEWRHDGDEGQHQ
jgi:hypothetical protein